jgi:hypothetical protein
LSIWQAFAIFLQLEVYYLLLFVKFIPSHAIKQGKPNTEESNESLHDNVTPRKESKKEEQG